MEIKDTVTLQLQVTFEAVAERPKIKSLPVTAIVAGLRKLAKERVEAKQQELLANKDRVYEIIQTGNEVCIYYTRSADNLDRCYNQKTISLLQAFTLSHDTVQDLFEFLRKMDKVLLYQLLKALATTSSAEAIPYRTVVLSMALDAFKED